MAIANRSRASSKDGESGVSRQRGQKDVMLVTFSIHEHQRHIQTGVERQKTSMDHGIRAGSLQKMLQTNRLNLPATLDGIKIAQDIALTVTSL